MAMIGATAKLVLASMLALVGFGRARKGRERFYAAKRTKRLGYKRTATYRMLKNQKRKTQVRRKIARASKQVNRRAA